MGYTEATGIDSVILPKMVRSIPNTYLKYCELYWDEFTGNGIQEVRGSIPLSSI